MKTRKDLTKHQIEASKNFYTCSKSVKSSEIKLDSFFDIIGKKVLVRGVSDKTDEYGYIIGKVKDDSVRRSVLMLDSKDKPTGQILEVHVAWLMCLE